MSLIYENTGQNVGSVFLYYQILLSLKDWYAQQSYLYEWIPVCFTPVSYPDESDEYAFPLPLFISKLLSSPSSLNLLAAPLAQV